MPIIIMMELRPLPMRPARPVPRTLRRDVFSAVLFLNDIVFWQSSLPGRQDY